MKRKDKLIVIHKVLKMLAPDTEYECGDYDIIRMCSTGYVEIFFVNKSMYVECNLDTDVPFEILSLFELHKLSNEESKKVYDTVRKNSVLLREIGTPPICYKGYLYKANLYRAISIDKNLFKDNYDKKR